MSYPRQHGHARFCDEGKCPVCLTPWPKMTPALIELELRKLSHVSKLIRASWGGYVPAGMSGEELWRISERVADENRKRGNDQR